MKTRTVILIGLAALCSQLLVNQHIMGNSRLLRPSDQEQRMLESIEVFKNLSEGNLVACLKQATSFNLQGPAHPKLFSFVQGVFLFLISRPGHCDYELMILTTNMFYLLLLFIAVFGIGAMLADRKTGLFAAVTVLFSPVVFSFSRASMLDLSLAAMVALTFFCLLRTRQFESLIFTILTALMFFFSQLTKETAWIFVFPVLAYYTLNSLTQRKRLAARLPNLLLFAAVFSLLLAGIFFTNRFAAGALRSYYNVFYYNCCHYDLFYADALLRAYLGVALSICVIPLLRRLPSCLRKTGPLLLLWAIVPFLVFSVLSFKAARYLMPIVPALFLTVAILVFSINNSYYRRIYVCLLALVIAAQYIGLNFFNKQCYLDEGIYCATEDENYYWSGKLIEIFREERPLDPEINWRILVIFDLGAHAPLYREVALKRMPFEISVPAEDEEYTKFHNFEFSDCENLILCADYIVDKTGVLSSSPFHAVLAGCLQEAFNKNKSVFTEISSFGLDNGDRVFIYKKDMQKALEYFTATLKLAPEYLIAYERLGWIHRRLGESCESRSLADEARAHFNKSLQLYPANPQAYLRLAQNLLKNKKFDAAIDSFNKALALKPDCAEAYNGLGWACREMGRLGQAEDYFDKALKIKSDFTAALIGLGWIYHLKGCLPEAEKCFYRSIGLDRQDREAYIGLGWNYHKMGNFPKAEEAFKKALELSPDYAEAYKGLAWTYRSQGKLKEAGECIDKWLKTHPGSSEAYCILGWSRHVENKLSEAERLFQKAIQLDSKNREGYIGLGWNYHKMGNFPKAEEAFKKALELSPDYAEAYKGLAWTYRSQGKLKEAGECIDKWLKTHPGSSEAYCILGWSRHVENKLSEAERLFQKAIQLDSKNREGYIGLGWNYHKSGKFNEAQKAFKQALALSPGYAEAYKGLAWTYRSQGKLKEAAQYLEKAGKKVDK